MVLSYFFSSFPLNTASTERLGSPEMGILQKVFHGDTLPQDRIPYPYVCHFDRKLKAGGSLRAGRQAN